jgi:hypothetical protein
LIIREDTSALRSGGQEGEVLSVAGCAVAPATQAAWASTSPASDGPKDSKARRLCGTP